MTLLESPAPAPMMWAAADDVTPRTEAEFRLADTDFWVASYRGYFGGTIDKQGDHFFVRDTFARYIGDFSDLETAKRKLEDHLEFLLPKQGDRP